MLTGKTIGQLNYLSSPTADTLFPVELSGATYHIEFSSITNNLTFEDVTYAELYDKYTGQTFVAGSYYRITDFQTCYDQPDYDYDGNDITTGNYKTGVTSPIIVFAISSDSLSSDAYQPEHPNDNIKYDITFNQTEVTNSPAFGRITYRKDNQGNAFDYDFREVLFKRYDTYVSEQVFNGTVSIDSEGIITGVETTFTNFSVGDIVGVLKTDSQGSDIVKYYEIVSISGDTNMVVTGNTISSQSNVRLVDANLLEGMSWKQNNIISNTNEYEYSTFQNYESCFNNISINNSTYTEFTEETFLLPNNVFRNTDVEFPSTYTDNLFGSNFRNNTFDDDCDSNIVRDDFYNNIITNDFDHNTINNTFRDNIIHCDFNSNTINGTFYKNHFGDEDSGDDFDFNIIDGSFYQNFYIGADHFEYNIIKGSFYNNIIFNEFSKNTLNGFYDNVVEDSFNNNQIGESFNTNRIYSSFNENTIGIEFYDNTIHSGFYENSIGDYFRSNTIGDSGNSSDFDFRQNRIGNYFESNAIRQDFQDNQIGNYFQDNIANGNFERNVIGHSFTHNRNIGYAFNNNHIGNEFNSNQSVIGDYFQNNQIGNYFQSNSVSYNFKNNQIGNRFEDNTLGDTDYFNWLNTNIENLTGRTYDDFYGSLDESIGKVILGKELIMHFTSNSGTTLTSGTLVIGETYEITNYIGSNGTDDFTNVAEVQSGNINENGCVFIAIGTTPTVWSNGTELTELTVYDEYHKVKFTQWTQGGNGGGFSYERTKVYPTVEPTVYFTKRNYENDVDVIVEGRLEIARNNNNGAIYNIAEENNFNQNVSPVGTEWNSIYTQNNNGSGFEYNIIGNEFKGNMTYQEFNTNKVDFGFASNQFSGVCGGNSFGRIIISNDFLGDVYGNVIKGAFGNNTIGDGFGTNNIGSGFFNNTISQNFANNEIGNFFNDNTIDEGFGFGGSSTQKNYIGDEFYNNTVGEYFYNNRVGNYFRNNTLGDYFQWNVIDTDINLVDFTVNYGNITGFTYIALGNATPNGTYVNRNGTTNGQGVDASFDIEVSGFAVTGVTGSFSGKLYGIGDTITIPGTQLSGSSGLINFFTSNGIGITGVTGSYTDILAQGGAGTGENSTFDVTVASGIVDSVSLTYGGEGYSLGNALTIPGSAFGGTEDIIITVDSVYSDDVVITVTGVTKPSVYEHYTCQIFERQGGVKRLSYYDSSDILTITDINE